MIQPESQPPPDGHGPLADPSQFDERTQFAEAELRDQVIRYRSPANDIRQKDAFELLRDLVEGNERWMSGLPIRPNQCEQTTAELANGQRPDIIIVSCSDSRVTPEIIFDIGLGRLFPIRGAGNLVGDTDMATIEFGLAKWSCPLLVVLGHEKCGAIDAALNGVPPELQESPFICGLLSKIRSNICDHTEDPSLASQANVKGVIQQIGDTSPIVAKAIAAGNLVMVGGVYDLTTKKVSFLS